MPENVVELLEERPLDAGVLEDRSTTTPAPATADMSSVQLIRARSSSLSGWLSFPAATARLTDVRTRDSLRSSAARSDSCTTTRKSARAAVSAMPEPMNPAPTTPTTSLRAIRRTPSKKRLDIRLLYVLN